MGSSGLPTHKIHVIIIYRNDSTKFRNFAEKLAFMGNVSVILTVFMPYLVWSEHCKSQNLKTGIDFPAYSANLVRLVLTKNTYP